MDPGAHMKQLQWIFLALSLSGVASANSLTANDLKNGVDNSAICSSLFTIMTADKSTPVEFRQQATQVAELFGKVTGLFLSEAENRTVKNGEITKLRSDYMNVLGDFYDKEPEAMTGLFVDCDQWSIKAVQGFALNHPDTRSYLNHIGVLEEFEYESNADLDRLIEVNFVAWKSFGSPTPNSVKNSVKSMLGNGNKSLTDIMNEELN
jgi:hypothetical protein